MIEQCLLYNNRDKIRLRDAVLYKSRGGYDYAAHLKIVECVIGYKHLFRI